MDDYTLCAVCKKNSCNFETRCKHVFHRICLENLLEKSDKCPICSGGVSLTDKIEKFLQKREVKSEDFDVFFDSALLVLLKEAIKTKVFPFKTVFDKINEKGVCFVPIFNEIMDLIVSFNRDDVLKYLLDINYCDYFSTSILMHFIKRKNLIFAEKAVEFGADLNAKNSIKKTALHYAYELGYYEFSRKLLEKGADPKALFNDSIFIVHIFEKDIKYLDLLLEYGVDINCKSSKNLHENTILHESILCGPNELVKYIIEKGADINALNMFDISSLMMAASRNNNEIFYLLIELGADINACDKYNRNMLYYASKSGNLETFKYLLEKSLDMNKLSEDGETVFHNAVESGKLEMVKLVIECGFDLELLKKYPGWKIFYNSFLKNNFDIVSYLLDVKAHEKVPIDKDYDYIYYAVSAKRFDIAKRLIDLGFPLELIYVYNVYKSYLLDHVLKELSEAEAWDFIEAIIKRYEAEGKDLNTIGILHESARHGKKEVLLRGIQKGLDVNHVLKEYMNCSPIFYVKDVEILDILLDNGAEINCENNFRQSPLFHHMSDIKIMNRLIERGADLVEKGGDGTSIIHYAAKKGSYPSVKRLLEFGMDPNIINKKGETPLHYLGKELCTIKTDKESDYLVTAKILLDAGADVDIKSNFGESFIDFISEPKYYEFVEIVEEIRQIKLE